MEPALHIACTADGRYAPYCAAMLHSLFVHNAHCAVTVHYLHPPEFEEGLKQQFGALAERYAARTYFHEVADAAVASLPDMRGIERLVWYRIFLPELLPALDRVLYLDADTLVLGSLDALWRTDLGGHPLAAVRNVIDPEDRHHLAELGLPDDAPYFNSGVLLINLEAWRRDDCTTRLLEVARQQGAAFLWADQDALNLVFRDRCLLLHPRWNCQNSLCIGAGGRKVFGAQAVEEATQQPGILHFEGPDVRKPWHYLSEHPYRAQYWRHLRASGFAVPGPEGRNWKTVIRKHAFWLWQPLHGLRHWWRAHSVQIKL